MFPSVARREKLPSFSMFWSLFFAGLRPPDLLVLMEDALRLWRRPPNPCATVGSIERELRLPEDAIQPCHLFMCSDFCSVRQSRP